MASLTERLAGIPARSAFGLIVLGRSDGKILSPQFAPCLIEILLGEAMAGAAGFRQLAGPLLDPGFAGVIGLRRENFSLGIRMGFHDVDGLILRGRGGRRGDNASYPDPSPIPRFTNDAPALLARTGS